MKKLSMNVKRQEVINRITKILNNRFKYTDGLESVYDGLIDYQKELMGK